MTFTQIQSRFIKSLRALRRSYRKTSTAGEKLERELDRLIKREHGQLIQPDDLKTAIKYYEAYWALVDKMPQDFKDIAEVLQMPVIA